MVWDKYVPYHIIFLFVFLKLFNHILFMCNKIKRKEVLCMINTILKILISSILGLLDLDDDTIWDDDTILL